jgi:histidine triad (HIT) family protein
VSAGQQGSAQGDGVSDQAVGEGYDGDDFYCDVAIPNAASLRVEYDDDWVLAFHHTRPYWRHHVVVVPKRHVPSLTTLGKEDEELVRRLLLVVTDVARAVEQRYGAAAVLTNLGAYQDSRHLHVHIHSGGPSDVRGPVLSSPARGPARLSRGASCTDRPASRRRPA